MTLKEKVLKMRADYKKNRIFYINNPSVIDKEYFGVFEAADGLHYDFADTTSAINQYRHERLNSGICQKYKILCKSEFLKLWFDYEFWLYCLNFADSAIEIQHYQAKIKKIT